MVGVDVLAGFVSTVGNVSFNNDVVEVLDLLEFSQAALEEVEFVSET